MINITKIIYIDAIFQKVKIYLGAGLVHAHCRNHNKYQCDKKEHSQKPHESPSSVAPSAKASVEAMKKLPQSRGCFEIHTSRQTWAHQPYCNLQNSGY